MEAREHKDFKFNTYKSCLLGKQGKITVCHFPKLILKNQITIQRAYFGLPQQSCLTVDQNKNQHPEKKMGNYKAKEQQKQLIRSTFSK